MTPNPQRLTRRERLAASPDRKLLRPCYLDGRWSSIRRTGIKSRKRNTGTVLECPAGCTREEESEGARLQPTR